MGAGDKTFDIVIVGMGPAGITGAIYAARNNLKVALIGEFPGGEVRNSGEIENWPGGGQMTGNELADQMIKHVQSHKDQVEILHKKVSSVAKNSSGTFTILLEEDELEGKTVIWAAGRHPRELGVEGESEFKNMGVTYCATCDAPLFTDREVAVVGGGNTGAEAVIMLQKIAKKIYLLHLDDKLTADSILIDNFKDDEMVEIILKAKTKRILGKGMVSGIVFEDVDSSKERTLDVQGVFVAIGAIPNTDPVKNLITLDKFGAVETDRYGRTDVEGFFAAGDVTNIRDAQIVVAAGHGCSAALSAGDYLARQTK